MRRSPREPGPAWRRDRSTPPAVYPEREDTLLLVPFARAGPGRSVLDLGTGNGRLALEAARSGSTVVATDRNPEALRALRARALAERLRLEVVRTDLARGTGRFDRIVANPPYLPTSPAERDPDPWVNLALDGGPDGCRILRAIATGLPRHLRVGGRAYVLTSDRQDRRSLATIRARWRGRGGTVRVVARRPLEGEGLEVWEFASGPGRGTASRRRGRVGRPRRGTGGRPRSRGRNPVGSSRGSGRGRTPSPGAASARRRSPRGS